MMKNIILLSVFYLLLFQASFGQDCETQAANKPSTLARGMDDFIGAVSTSQKPKSWDITKMKLHLDKTESWIKNLLTGFTGAKLLYSNEYYLDPLDFTNLPEDAMSGSFTKQFHRATSIKGFYGCKMRFYAYYCYENNNPIYTEVESGSYIHVNFNNVFASDLCTDVGVFTINGKPAFKIFGKDHSEGRIDFYQQRAITNGDETYASKQDYIFIRNSDKPLFIPITRKEYLEQMLKDVETYRAKQKEMLTDIYSNRLKDFEREVKIKKQYGKNYTAEREALERKRFAEDNKPDKMDKDLQKLDADIKGTKEVIIQYQGKSQDWLSRGFSTFYPYDSYSAKGLTEYLEKIDVFTESRKDFTRTEVVSLNPTYFNNKLSVDVPQLISIHLTKGTYPHMLKVAKLIKQPGALAPLAAILNPGKTTTPPVVVPEITSTYTLKYLPKLTELIPLIVPADMKPSTNPFANNYNSNTPAAKFDFDIPAHSSKLNQLSHPVTSESYKTYVQQLNTSISNAVKPDVKKKAEAYLAGKKLTQSKDIGNAAFAAWLQNSPESSLYLFSKALVNNPSDALTANNFSAFLMMGGLPEKSIPILEYWNKQKPGEATILSNLGNAYYRLGDLDNAMMYLQQCVQKDSLNPTANKLLCMMYLKKGDTKKAEAHGTKSLTTSYDEQVISMLHQVNSKVKPGEIMSRLPVTEFPMLKRVKLPAMPSNLNEMEQFEIELDAEKKSIEMTIDNIDSKTPEISEDLSQQLLMASLIKGVSPLRVKAQYIIMDGMQTYHRESIRESDVFKYQLKKLAEPFNAKTRTISKNYAEKLNKLEGGEAGDDDEIDALLLAKCKEINAEKEKYLAGLSPLVNRYVQRQEFIARKFYRDYAYWAPYWMPETTLSFPSIERDYLKAISGILSSYKTISKSNCSPHEPLEKKGSKLKEWEDEYCANFKGKVAVGPGKFFFTCNSWGIEGGEGFVGDIEMKYRNDGSFENFTVGAGVGANWHLGKEGFINTEIGVSGKGFIKIGPDAASGDLIIQDVGAKAEVAGEASIGEVAVEEKVIEVSVAVNAGFEAGGIVPSVFNLK